MSVSILAGQLVQTGRLAGRLDSWLTGWAGWLAGLLANWPAASLAGIGPGGQNGATPDVAKKVWICDYFMKAIVTFLEGSLAGWLAG